MGAIASAVRQRSDLSVRLADARARTDELFAIVRPEAMYERPISERHRIIFYVGHLEAFDWNLLADRAFGLKPFQRTFDQLFSFGIDPVGGGLPTDTAADWPAREEILAYTQKIRDKLDQAIDEALSRPGDGHPQLKTMLEVAIEHRLMHAETLAYMLHRLPARGKNWRAHGEEAGENTGEISADRNSRRPSDPGSGDEHRRRIWLGQRDAGPRRGSAGVRHRKVQRDQPGVSAFRPGWRI